MATTHLIGGFRVSERVLGAVHDASRRTGADFRYMLANAARESGFRADAEAPTSSATGLYQFIESTWLETVRDHGAKHGLAAQARLISTDADGRPAVADPAARQQILDLRRDPRLNALMAGELTNDNKAFLERRFGGEIGNSELYLAHFLGAESAASFLGSMRVTPDRPAADLFPAAARANRAVFFDRDSGAARSLAEVYRQIDRSMAPTRTASLPNSEMPGRPMTDLSSGDAAGSGHVWGTSQRSLALRTLLYLNALPIPGE